MLASASWDGTVRLWDSRTGLELVKGPSPEAHPIRFSRDGRLLGPGHDAGDLVALGGDRGVRVPLAGRRRGLRCQDLVDRLPRRGRRARRRPASRACDWRSRSARRTSAFVGVARDQGRGHRPRRVVADHERRGGIAPLAGPPPGLGRTPDRPAPASRAAGRGPDGTDPARSATAGPRRGRRRRARLGSWSSTWRAPVRRSSWSAIATWSGSPCSPDGRWAVTGTWQGTGVKVWDARRGVLVHELPVDGSAEVVFSSGRPPSGDRVGHGIRDLGGGNVGRKPPHPQEPVGQPARAWPPSARTAACWRSRGRGATCN